jgi:hypothetical protein
MRDVRDVVNPIQIQLDALAAVSGIILGYVFFALMIRPCCSSADAVDRDRADHQESPP